MHQRSHYNTWNFNLQVGFTHHNLQMGFTHNRAPICCGQELYYSEGCDSENVLMGRSSEGSRCGQSDHTHMQMELIKGYAVRGIAILSQRRYYV